MNFNNIRRVKFYENQYLKAEDLQAEQDYHLMMRRLHLAADHTFGIVWGLEIVRNPESGECRIKPGLAIDGFGREIVVSHPKKLTSNDLSQIKNAAYRDLSELNKPPSYATHVGISYDSTDCPSVNQLWNVCIDDKNIDRVQEKFQLAYGNFSGFVQNFQRPTPANINTEESPERFFPIYLGTVCWESYDDHGLPKISSVKASARWYSGNFTSNLIAPAGQLWVWSPLKINPLNIINDKTGGLATGMTFGWESREGISSERDENKVNQNPYGLDFYTGKEPRLSIQQNGYVGIGTRSPKSKLHVKGEQTGNAKIADHIVCIENIGSHNADVLALKIGVDQPDESNNFITFFGGDKAIGAIEVNTTDEDKDTPYLNINTKGADYAEYLPSSETLEASSSGYVIGVESGQATSHTSLVQHLTVITNTPAVIGNHPQGDTEHQGVNASFIGQVKVRVEGAVQAGDYIAPSGLDDGVGQAISPEDVVLASNHSQFIGRAWESSSDTGVKTVNTAVGLPSSWPIAEMMTLLRQQQAEIQALRVEVEELKSKFNQTLCNPVLATPPTSR